MSLRHKSKVVEDVVATNVEAAVVEQLLDFLMNTVGKIAPTLARRASFVLGDFPEMVRLGLGGFELALSVDHSGEVVICYAEFLNGLQRVRATVSLND